MQRNEKAANSEKFVRWPLGRSAPHEREFTALTEDFDPDSIALGLSELQEGDAEGDAVSDAEGTAEVDAQGPHRWGSEKAREAARLRWSKEREREASEVEAVLARADEDVRLVTTPIRVGAIMKRLEADAVKGSATAAKELRSWLDAYPPQDDSFDASALDRRTRARIYALLIAHVQQEEVGNPAYGHIPGGMIGT